MPDSYDPRDLLERRTTVCWTLVIAYAALIFFFSSLSHPPQPIQTHDEFSIRVLSTVEHVLEYAIFGFLLAAAYKSLGGIFNKKAFLLAAAAGLIYAVTDELHQSFVPGRDCSITDVSADFLGAVIGSFIETRRRKEAGRIF